MSWERAASIEDLQTKHVVVFRHKAKQIAIIQKGERIFAIDNRCPHEGYPLSQGTVNESCVLTCQWHNWKFDLNSGDCLVGQDNVRTYPTKQEDGDIWVDLSPLPPQVIFEQVSKSLQRALFKHDLGQIGRELARLHFNGLDPLSVIPQTLEWSHVFLEYGHTHAYAGLADWLTLYDENEGDMELQLTCLTEALEHIAFDVIRHEEYPYSEEVLAFSHEALKEAIEKEDEAVAIPLLRGALQAGLGIKELEKTLSEVALNHYNSFGHSLIYVMKTAQLVERLGKAVEQPLLLSLVRHLCYTTREDLIPDFDKYANYLDRLQWTSDTSLDSPVSALSEVTRHSIRQSMEWTVQAAAQHAPQNVHAKLLEACAQNMLEFDEQFDHIVHQRVKDNVGWLDFTHALTFGSAIRQQCEKFPDLWGKGVLQLACFHGRNLPYVKPVAFESWDVKEVDTFWQETKEKLRDHGLRVPILAVHLLKTSLAVKEETEATPGIAPMLLAALNRFLQSPIRQKHTRRLIFQGMQLVGKDFVEKG